MILQTPQRLHVDVRAPGDTMTVFHPPRDITPVERVIRWFFSVPQWVQLAGAALAIVIALLALVIVWRNARAIRRWLRDRHRTTPIGWKLIGGVLAVAVLLGMAGSGATFFVYSQNDNQFCLSCHELHDEVYQRFAQSKHHRVADLRCHDCHDEPLVAEMAQVGKWMLLRPAKVGPHAPVPREVCASCHVRKNADSTWQRIIATAGHTVHLRTDTAHKLGIDCLTCHGVTAHRFVPVAQTCAQSGCHANTQIKLGRMAGQTSLHCVTCHQFTAPVSEQLSTQASFAGLVPSQHNCLGCHEMQKVIERFVPKKDPHKGLCGSCHNPHTQKTPKEAYTTCTNSGCHTRPDTLTPFHRGAHAKTFANCGACHQEHTWKVNGTQCLDCHQNVYRLPAKRAFPTVRGTASVVLQPVALLAAGAGSNALVARLIAATAPSTRAPSPPQSAQALDSVKFSHGLHRGLACAKCHTATGASHGAVTLTSVRDCERCHHDETVNALGGGTEACLHCHTRDSLPSVMRSVAVRTSTSPAELTRTLPFAHATHASVACAECHTTPVTLAAQTTCASCHHSHHEQTRTCITCHDARAAHEQRASMQQLHLGCAGSGCHTDRTVLALEPTRNVCLSCHAAQVNHKTGGDCGTCHRVHWSPASASGGDGRVGRRDR